MTGYVRKDTTNNIADGNVINAADLDSEFDGVQAAFNSSTGHTHDGTASEGAPITKLGPVQDVTVSTTVLGVKTTNTVDLGTSSLKFKDFYLAGAASIGGTLGVTGATTLSAALTYGGVTLSNAVTGTGNMVLSASPTLTGTITAAAANFSGAVAFNGTTTIGDADTDTITQAASYVTGTQLKSAKTATNTLSLAAYDVDGTAYTNLITLTAGNTPTLALTSTGVGSMDNIAIGATTASTGAFTTLSANSTVTLSGGTANGVAYLNGSKVVTTGSALVFDGTNLGVGTSSPAYKLVVAGTAPRIVSQDTTSNYITVLRGGNTLGYVGTESNIPFQIVTNSNTAATFDTSGNLGLGVTPSAWSTNYKALQSATGSSFVGFAGNDQTFVVSNAFNDGAWKYKNTSGAGYYAIQGVSNGVHAWFTAPSGTAGNAITFTQAMTLDASGNLALGTTSSLSPSSGRIDLTINGTSSAMTSFGTGNTRRGYFLHDATDLTIASETAGSLRFLNNGSERARIDSSGNLGLGVTPSGWSGFRALQVGGATSIWSSTSGAGSSFYSNNVYFNGSNRIRINAGYATEYIQDFGAGNHLWFTTTSSTAGSTITFTQAMTLDASGRLGIGTSSPTSGYLLDVRDRARVASTSNYVLDLIGSGTNGSTLQVYADNSIAALITTGTSAIPLTFYTGGSERARIDSSGNLLVGQTTTGLQAARSFSFQGVGDGSCYVSHSTANASGDSYIQFGYNGTKIGSITQSGTTAVAYNTSSDYRLKEDIQPMTGALTKVAALKPVAYKWKSDGSDGEGFIAHELAEVCPHAVTGEKDAVDENGNPKYQGIDTSFLVATLTAAIQEMKAIIDTQASTITQLQADVAALKGA